MRHQERANQLRSGDDLSDAGLLALHEINRLGVGGEPAKLVQIPNEAIDAALHLLFGGQSRFFHCAADSFEHLAIEIEL
jgi:hypothetical protein